ncbi:clusterin-associated protein 1 [Thecamonas trahens ATCC 50062]|uniref:Clusterin-associated protein 1 n=1 Tax=Thecamonas trahens ATCC 50062 TaxID=461836 RepID=A0A0L0DDC6_THETB|nr:clusterin-associated protein 1 [Thecamonas trahens ATCC 50062]KNC50086.1 clusterin-associated protein 1 [Thecamonas trahens ATCC 50062]|eukprot:XP_013757249.1 clusterin-associated protein 1 [Thecamonas trahens ATCC 50062]
MSYRNVRDFTEMMRALGYPEAISLEAFRYPNFILVSDVLVWLVRRYDAHAQIPTDIETESDRELFLTAVVSFMYKQARIKLNPRKLLMADGYAVKELLKLASLLYKASKVVAKAGGDALAAITRALASELTKLSAELFDLLEREEALRSSRTSAIERNLDMDALAKSIRAAAAAAKQKTDAILERFKSLSSDEEHLRKKISKKEDELARKGQRMDDLKGQRPAYMDDYQLKDAAQFDEAAKSLEALRTKLHREEEARILGDDAELSDDHPTGSPSHPAAQVRGSFAGGDDSSSSGGSSIGSDDEDSDF